MARSSARADTALLQRTYMQEIHFVPLPPHRPSGRSSTPDPRPHLRARSGYEYSCVPPHLHTPSPWPTICRRPTPASRPSFLPRRRPITVLLFSLSLSLSLSFSLPRALSATFTIHATRAGWRHVCLLRLVQRDTNPRRLVLPAAPSKVDEKRKRHLAVSWVSQLCCFFNGTSVVGQWPFMRDGLCSSVVGI